MVMSRLEKERKKENRTTRIDITVDKTQPFSVTHESTRCGKKTVHRVKKKREGVGERRQQMKGDS